MTRCSDKEDDEQSDDGAGKPRKNQEKKKRSKEAKHVSFPPDEQIVSGFQEHRNTDRKADRCLTLTEVTVAYQQSCSKHQVQPRAHILHQLQQGVCVGGSVKCLDLKGERLDHRSCEALEVVLKSLHFDFINLQAAQLEENGASSLLDMILYYESTTHLDISDNSSMGTSAWRALAHLIKQLGAERDPNGHSMLPTLPDSNLLLQNSSHFLDLFDILGSRNPHSSCAHPSPHPTLSAFAESPPLPPLPSQQGVLAEDHCLRSEGPLIAGLGARVGALKSNRALQELHLTNNLLNSYQDALQLGDLLRYNTTLQTLELSNNAVADPGLEELCDGLRWQTAGLKVLLLRNNQITAKGMVHLAKALPVLKVLQVLDLGENLLGNEGIQLIREPLMLNCSVLQLGLAQANITCEGAVALAEFLAESRQIQHLDVRQNEVKVGGLMALCLALRINRSLARLDLDHIPPQEQFYHDAGGRLKMRIFKRREEKVARGPSLSAQLSDEDISVTGTLGEDQLVSWMPLIKLWSCHGHAATAAASCYLCHFSFSVSAHSTAWGVGRVVTW
ncbi:hypothetical protein PAMA_004509 [Pampus argenteus]